MQFHGTKLKTKFPEFSDSKVPQLRCLWPDLTVRAIPTWTSDAALDRHTLAHTFAVRKRLLICEVHPRAKGQNKHAKAKVIGCPTKQMPLQCCGSKSNFNAMNFARIG